MIKNPKADPESRAEGFQVTTAANGVESAGGWSSAAVSGHSEGRDCDKAIDISGSGISSADIVPPNATEDGLASAHFGLVNAAPVKETIRS